MEKIKIRRVSRFNTDKIGNQLMTKFGKPWTKVYVDDGIRNILVRDWNNLTSNWAEGTEIELDVREKTYNGQIYFEGTLPDGPKFGKTNPKIDTMATQMDEAIKILRIILAKVVGKQPEDFAPKPEIKNEVPEVVKSSPTREDETIDDSLPF